MRWALTAPAAHGRPAPARSRPARQGIAAAAALAIAAFLAAGCGGGSASTPRGVAASHGRGAPGARPAATGQWRTFSTLLDQQAAAGRFSGAVLIARDGKPLLEGGYGWADRAAGVRNTSQATFCVASIGKLFTAVAIAQLAEQHKLSFGDTIGRYLSGFPPAVAGHVTIGELLSMTSGLGDVALGRPNPPATLAAMMKLIEAERVQSPPGSRFVYSNDGYIVLGAVVEHVTGQSYDSYLHQHIFIPAGMTHTDVTVYTPAHVPGMAHGYQLSGLGGAPAQAGPPPPGAGAGRAARQPALQDNSGMPRIGNPSGGGYSTTGDLLAFARALTGHRLLSPAMTATVLTPRVNSPQPGGPRVDMYTYGFAYQQIHGVTFVGHNGGTPGYEAQIDIYPATGYVAVILANQDHVLLPAIQRSEAMLAASSLGGPAASRPAAST